MNKKLLLLQLGLATVTTGAFAQFESAPAFPGAEGHGRFVTGGRGGEIRHVTNLNDSGSGSLREAVKGSNKKIVVFDVGGVIALNSDLTIGANTTILGQTAPGTGITVRYYTVKPSSNNIIRFLRIRRGQERDVNDGADASTQRHITGIIFDHCSFSWSIDEVASFYDNNNFTMQWCTVAESLTNAGHDKGAHGYGGIWGGKLASFHHNLVAHVANRGPRFNGARYGWQGYTSNYNYKDYKWATPTQAENVDFRNCVMYNAQGTCYGGPGGGQINIVNNFYKAGPCGVCNQERVTLVTVSEQGNSDSSHPEYYGMTSRYYISGNTTLTTAGVKKENRDWDGVSYDSGVLYRNNNVYSKDANKLYAEDAPSIEVNGNRYVQIKMEDEAPKGFITTHTADVAYEKVLDYAGASLTPDYVDQRYAKETRNGTATYTGSVTKKPGIIDVVADVEGYTEGRDYMVASHPEGYDTDGDGIPDEWEKKWGLNPNDASDAKKYTMDPNGYYTNLEMYANSLVENIMKNECADGEANYSEYWPELKVIENKPVVGENVSITLAVSTYQSGTSTMEFTDGDYTVTVTNNKNKTYGAGKEDGVKYSAGAQYTFTIPDGLVLQEIKLKGYDNYAGTDAYIGEVNGTEYDATKYAFPMKDDSGNYTVVEHSIPVNNATKSFTMTPMGKQVAVTIILNCTTATAVKTVSTDKEKKGGYIYNVAGQRVNNNYKGMVVKNGKTYINK